MTCQGSFSAITCKQSDASNCLANSVNSTGFYTTGESNEAKKFIAELTNSRWVKHYRSVCVEMSRGSQRFNKSNESMMPNLTSQSVVRPPHVYSVRQRVVSFIRGAFRRNLNVSTSRNTRASGQTNVPKHASTHLMLLRQYRGSSPVAGWKGRKVTVGNGAVHEIVRTKKSDQYVLSSTRNSARRSPERKNVTRPARASTSSSRDQSNSQNSTPNPRPSALVISSSNRSREGVAKRTRFSLHPSTCNAPPDLLRPRRDSEDTANSVSSLVDMSHRSEIVTTDLTSVCGDSTTSQKPRTCENNISTKTRILLSDSTARDKELRNGMASELPKAFPTSMYEEKRHQVTPTSTRDGIKRNLAKVQGTKRGLCKKQHTITNVTPMLKTVSTKRPFVVSAGLRRASSITGTFDERRKVMHLSTGHQSSSSTPVLSVTPETPVASPESPVEPCGTHPKNNELSIVRTGECGQADRFRVTRSDVGSFELCSLPHSVQSSGLGKPHSSGLQVQRQGPYRFRCYRKLISELDQMHRNYAAPYEIAREMVDDMCQFRLNEIAQSLLLRKPRPAYYEKMTMIADSNGDANTQSKDDTNLPCQPVAHQICDDDHSDECESLRSKPSNSHTTSAALSTQEPVGILCLPVRRARNKLKLENVATKPKVNSVSQHVSVNSGAGYSSASGLDGELYANSSRLVGIGYQTADKTKPPRTSEISIQPFTAAQCNQPTEKGVQFDGEPVLYYNHEFMGLTQREECQNVRICHGTQTTYSIPPGGDHDGFSELDDSQDMDGVSAGECSIVRTVMQSPQPIDAQPPRTPLSCTVTKPVIIRNPMSPVEINMKNSDTPHSYTESNGCSAGTQSAVSFVAVCQEGVNTVASSIQERTRSGNSESVIIQPNVVDCIYPLSQPTGKGTHCSGANKSTVSPSCLPRDGPLTLLNVAKLVVLPSPLQLVDDPGSTETPLLYRCHVASSATQTELNEEYETQPSVSLPEQQSISPDVVYAIQYPQSCEDRSELVPEKLASTLDVRGMLYKRKDKVMLTVCTQTGRESVSSILNGSGSGVIDSASTKRMDEDATAELRTKMTTNPINIPPPAEFAAASVFQAKQQLLFDTDLDHWKASNHSLPTKLPERKKRNDESNEISERSTVWSHPHLAEQRRLSPERECRSDYGYYAPVMQRPGSIFSDIGRTPLSRALKRSDPNSGDSGVSVSASKPRRNVAFLTQHGRAHSIRRQKWTNGDLEMNDADTSSSISPPPQPGVRIGNRNLYEQKTPIISQNLVNNRGRVRHPSNLHRRQIDPKDAILQHRSIGDHRTCIGSGLGGLRRHSSIPQFVRPSSSNSEGTKILDAHSLLTSGPTASSPITGKACQLARRQPMTPDLTMFRHANCFTPRNMLPHSTKKTSRSTSSLVDSHRCRRPGSSHSTGCSSVPYNQRRSSDPHAPRPGNASSLMRPASGEPKLAQRTPSSYNRRGSPRRLRSLKSPHTHNSTRCNEDNLLRHTFASLQKVRTKTLCSASVACRPPMVFKR